MAGSGKAHLREGDDVLLRVDDLVVEYRTRSGAPVQAVSGISLDIRRGETLGLVGESGCGKSTTGRAITLLVPPTSGAVRLEGQLLSDLSGQELRRSRRKMLVIFQDAPSSLNPRRTVRALVAEGLAISGAPKPWDTRVDDTLRSVGLDPEVVGQRRASELSGGQCQRVALARALVLEPQLLVCDEPVSALDVSVQAQVLNLFEDMRERFGLTMLMISHDLAVVKNVSDRVAVMYLGKLCEVASSDDLYGRPAHPYTEALINAIPDLDPKAARPPMGLVGELPSPIDPPSGCRFRTRCPRAQARCAVEEPITREVGPEHFVACHFPTVASDAALAVS